MKKFNALLKVFITILFLSAPIALFAQDIGKSWEFNTDDDFEGISLNSSWIAAEVKDGYLTGTIAIKNPSLSSDTFRLAAADYGFVQIRLKIKGATKGDFLWNNDAGQWGMSSFSLSPDTTFQVINIPVFLNAQWKGNITRIMRISLNPEVGSRVVIDYIRVFHGYYPNIVKFIPLRTVFKVHANIPLIALINNPGDEEGHLYSKLVLPGKTTLLSGSLENDHGIMFATPDSVEWSVRFDSVGVYDITLMVLSDRDTVKKVISLNVTDKYWKQDDFLLSAWSPPYAWYGPPYLDTVFEYYKNANFNNMLWVRDDDSLMAKVHQFGFNYFLDVFNVIGNEYLRAPDKKVPPDIPEAKLQNLDNLVNKYKNDPNLIGYFICDEPEEEAFENIRMVIDRIRKIDPDKLDFVNLYGWHDWSEEYVKKFLQTTGIQLLSYDHYIFKNDEDGKYYFKNLEFFRKYALMYDLPFCNIIQAIGTNGTSQSSILNWRTPTEAEHRWLVYSSLTYGVHALIWFHWHLDWGLTGNPDRDTIYPSIQKVNAEIDSLSAIMFQLKTTGVYHTVPNEKEDEKPLPPDGLIQSVSIDSGFVAAYYSGLVAGYFQDEEENDYFMLMNENYNDSVDVTVHLNGIANELRYFDVDENQWKDVSTSDTAGHTVFNIYLRPGGGKLFSVTLSPTGIPLHKTRNESGVILKQNYPNPFHGNTTIDYTVKPSDNGGFMPQRVNLRVFDQYGREVAVLVRQYQFPGSYKVVFHAESLAPGIYYYRLATEKQVHVRKMLLLR